ncbi:hypothetical protein H5410_060209 [Solanum commersonii]|uniref:Uncharacterized protein n=1 Tax=Solanum commersonii TaxID=4109 RepID=A0A9J5W4G3_SOLCO|nr:hypothetical protein H5410_060209 [Solanum commersonii]
MVFHFFLLWVIDTYLCYLFSSFLARRNVSSSRCSGFQDDFDRGFRSFCRSILCHDECKKDCLLIHGHPCSIASEPLWLHTLTRLVRRETDRSTKWWTSE